MRQRTSPFDPYLPQVGCWFVVLALAAVCLMPLVMLRVMEDALRHLHLPGWLATLTVFGIFIGSVINLPLLRIDRGAEQPVMRGYMVPGLGWVPLPRKSEQTILAVNVGGCIIPVVLALFEASYVIYDMPPARWALAVAAGVNIAVCYFLARPIPGVGIAIPAFVPPLAAIGLAWLLLSGEQFNEIRAPVAFVAGVAGPLIGADLLHLRRFADLRTGILSIGGAGTFDGIVISGILAAFFT